MGRRTWERSLPPHIEQLNSFGKIPQLDISLDRLPALSGIARAFNQDLQAEYLASVWLCCFEFGLCWYRVGPPIPDPAPYQAPSFSQASLNSHVRWDKPPSPLGFDHPPLFHSCEPGGIPDRDYLRQEPGAF